MTKSRITARKYRGDDYASWAVFIDGQPFVTGLTHREVPYYKKQAADILADLPCPHDKNGPCGCGTVAPVPHP